MQSWGSLGPLLERSWALLGPSGDRGALLGHLWGYLGPSCGHLEASRARSEKAKHIDVPPVFEGSWPLGGAFGASEGSGGTWNRLGVVLRPLGCASEVS
eukprot:1685266-Pyramimonas_sp.AAC.1